MKHEYTALALAFLVIETGALNLDQGESQILGQLSPSDAEVPTSNYAQVLSHTQSEVDYLTEDDIATLRSTVEYLGTKVGTFGPEVQTLEKTVETLSAENEVLKETV